MDSLRRKRRNQLLALILPAAGLAAMILMNVKEPAPEEREADAFTKVLLEAGARRRAGQELGAPPPISNAERDELRRQWQRFSPESRRKIFQEVARQRLREMRAEIAGVPPEERTRRIAKAVEQMRSQRRKLSGAEQEQMREQLRSSEGKEMVRNILGFYQNELTAVERAELDPLVHEWLYQIEELAGGR